MSAVCVLQQCVWLIQSVRVESSLSELSGRVSDDAVECKRSRSDDETTWACVFFRLLALLGRG